MKTPKVRPANEGEIADFKWDELPRELRQLVLIKSFGDLELPIKVFASLWDDQTDLDLMPHLAEIAEAAFNFREVVRRSVAANKQETDAAATPAPSVSPTSN